MSALTHFITAPTFHRKRVFHNELFGELLTETLMSWRQTSNVRLHDYVIMPDHIHLLITLPNQRDAEPMIEQLQASFVDVLARQYGYRGEVWSPAFRDVEVHGVEECASCTRKIHSNPVRNGFCDNPIEYRMSSKASRWQLDPLPDELRGITAQAV